MVLSKNGDARKVYTGHVEKCIRLGMWKSVYGVSRNVYTALLVAGKVYTAVHLTGKVNTCHVEKCIQQSSQLEMCIQGM